MTDRDYKLLEGLLIDLRKEIGFDYLIVPFATNDGVSMAIYDKKGNFKDSVLDATIERCVQRLKKLNP